MTDATKNRGNKQIIYFFLGFLIFFAFSFSLGVIVGKQIGRSMDRSLDDVSNNIDIESGTGDDVTEDGPENFVLGRSETTNDNDTYTEKQESPNKNENASEARSEIEEINTDGSTLQSTQSSSAEIDGEDVVAKTVEEDAKPSSQSQNKIISDKAEIDKSRKELTSLPPIDPQGRYTVQVGSFLEEKAAVQFLNSLQLKRYPAFVKRVVIPGYGASYRVRIGTFGTRDKANVYGESLKRLEPNIKSVYITMND